MMRKVLMYLKTMLGIFTFVLVCAVYSETARANTATASYDANLAEAQGEKSVDVYSIMSKLAGKELKDGQIYQIDDTYEARVEISMVKDAKSGMSLMSTTNSYYAICNVYITYLGSSVNVATINHTISLTYNDSGLVHINYGSVTATTLVSYISAYAYGYSVTNTDGTYSYATGMVRLYNSNTSLYSYMGCGVSVHKGGSPVFDFSQV